jgi:hypothetical protein
MATSKAGSRSRARSSRGRSSPTATTTTSLEWLAGGDDRWTDQLVEATVKIGSVLDQTCRIGLAARFTDVRNYYFLQLGADGRLRARTNVNGSTADLTPSSTGAPLAPGNVFRLGLGAKGSTITTYLNGTAVASATDPNPVHANGGIALGLQCIGATFDDVRVTRP